MEQPKWMQESVPPPPPQTNAPNSSTAINDPGGKIGKLVRVALHTVNLGLSALMAFAAVVGVFQNEDAVMVHYFLAGYLLIFAVLLATYEILRLLPEGRLQVMLRRNFGWFYGVRGRGLYLVFVGFLSIGLGNGIPLNIGIVCLIWGALSVTAHFFKPEWFEIEKGK